MRDPDAGFDPLLVARMEAVLPACRANGVRVVTNMGAANPKAAARATAAVARRLGLPGLLIAAVAGDEVLDLVRDGEHALLERPGTVASLGNSIRSANAYMGVGGVLEALLAGADVIIIGRVGDPALFLGPLVHEFGWALDDWDRLGKGTVVGHLLECAGEITGGYFADPGYKDVPDLARLGFPIAEVSEDGSAVITKVEGSGGRISLASCKEQLLYELLDPTAYLQPDVTADFSTVRFEELGPNRIAVSGGSGRQQPDTLKVSVGYLDSYVGEGQISYSGDSRCKRSTSASRRASSPPCSARPAAAEHAAESRGRLRSAERGTSARIRRPGHPARAAGLRSVPGAGAVPLAVGLGERGVRPEARRPQPRRIRGIGARVHRDGGPGRVRTAPAGPAQRRHEAARRHRPRLAHAPASAAHGRAVRGLGRADAAADAGAAAPALGALPQDHPVHHSRHRRSDPAGRHDLCDERPAGPHPSAHPGGPASAARDRIADGACLQRPEREIFGLVQSH